MTSFHHSAGFSLIEVMVCILILGVALVGLTAGLNTALVSNKDSETQTVAAMFAAGLIETTRADAPIDDGETQGDCGEELPLYQWKEAITASTVDGLHEVKVTIENSRSGQEIYELRTLLFDPPAEKGDKDSKSKKKKEKRS